jgi:endonuclease III-like uncharacterized protein
MRTLKAGERAELTVDSETGDLVAHVHGIKGKGCDEIQKLLEEHLGDAGTVRATSEYYAAEVRTGARVGVGR